MLKLPLKDLEAEQGTPFPIYLYLPKNNRLILLRLPGDPIGQQTFHILNENGQVEVWVPKQFEKLVTKFLFQLKNPPVVVQPLAEVPPPPPVVEVPPEEPPIETNEEAAFVRDVLLADELSTEEKAEILCAVSQDLLRAIKQITERGESARAEAVKRCKEIADEIIGVAAQNSNIYDQILALRNSQEIIDHSVFVGSISVMFALALGLADEALLADISAAALFHDIGLVKVKADIISKLDTQWSDIERKEYETHVNAGLEILKQGGVNYHPRVFRMIAEHHENYDGSGFPLRKKGADIDELSQILHMGNLFDRLCEGKETGDEMSPADAFDFIIATAENREAVQEIRPELVQRIFQFMLVEKEAAALVEEETIAQVDKLLSTG